MTRRKILAVAAAGVVAACGSATVLGDYGGDSCTYENSSLRENGVAVVTWNGEEIVLEYHRDGDKIIFIKKNGSSSRFTLKGNDLVLEGSMYCTRK